MTDVSGAAVPTDSTQAVPVTQGGSVIGVVVPDSGISSKELLRTVCKEIAPVVEVIRLRQELATAIRDVEASRHRLLTAGYEERRRLQRDLHDGAQQRLISLGVSLRLAQRHLEPGNEDLEGLFDQAVAELETSVAELRSISHGLGPATLRGGLASALHSLATSAPIAVDLDLECDDVPEDVAATAYYVANEALANALKHAGAQHASVVAHRQNGELTISVHDDGRGGADPRLGLGLAGLSDRVAATGGRFHIASADGDGTTVQAVIPCGS
jgi:signal transduction histidine kinase